MTDFKCPVDGATVEIPARWDRDTVVAGVVAREREENRAMYLAYHVRLEHGREALLRFIQGRRS